MEIKRIKVLEAVDKAGEIVKVSGWVKSRRGHGKIIFIDLRDRSGAAQVVFCADEIDIEQFELADRLRSEWVVEVVGEVKSRSGKMINEKLKTGTIEISGKEIKILAKTEGDLPVEIEKENMNVQLSTLLDHRVLTLRNDKVSAIFKIYARVLKSFADVMNKNEFTEIKTPKIVASATEGGANFFAIKYFEKKAYLAQSPQFYKQIGVGVFERVFEVGSVFRAEPHFTSRHVNEYIGLDAEMGFIRSVDDVMDMLAETMKAIIKDVEENCKEELGLHQAEKVLVPEKFPKIKLRDALDMLEKEYGKKIEEFDIDSEGEQLICEYAKKKYNSDFVFLTHYPLSGRPFYTMPDSEDKTLTASFDLLFKGMEIASGSQRIHSYQDLVDAIKSREMDPEQFKFYLDVFSYGMPPHGGWGLGSERIVKQILGLDSIKEAIMFPRDVKRIMP